MQKILIIDDDPDIALLLKRYLEKNGFEAETAFSLQKARSVYDKFSPAIVLCDYRLPDGDGIEWLEYVKEKANRAKVIILTGYSDVKVAINCIKLGAFDYVTKPIQPEEILHAIRDALKTDINETTTSGGTKSKKPSRSSKDFKRFFIEGKSPQSLQLSKLIGLVAPTDMSVIITGETGTGKEYAARRIHDQSERKKGPFVAIDCGALSKEIATSELFGHKKGAFTGALQDKVGAFEFANGGTLFLDEIANLSYENQIKLLRVLQEKTIQRLGETKPRKIDVRILAATNEYLRKKSRDGEFREDLYHRLNEFSIDLSPLRERQSEIIQYAEHFVEKANEQLSKQVKGFEQEAKDVLMNHPWPGNIRELKNVIKRAVLLAEGKLITPSNLPIEIKEPGEMNISQVENSDVFHGNFDSLKKAAENAEYIMIKRTLERTGYNKSKTAKLLKVDRKTLYNKMSAYGISFEP